MNTEWSITTRHIVSIGLFIFGVYLIYLSRSVITLVILAALIAFVLMPIVEFFRERLKMSRGWAVLLTYVLAVAVILLSPLVFLPPVIDGFNFLSQIDYQILVEDTIQLVESWLISLSNVNVSLGTFRLNLEPTVAPMLEVLQDAEQQQDTSLEFLSFENIADSLRSAATITFDFATNIAGTVFSGVLTMIVLTLSAIYISLDAHTFRDRLLAVLPAAYHDEVGTLLRRLNRIWRAYFRGQLYLMLIIGVVTWLGTYMLGLRGAFALGVIAGLMELIPNLGPFLAAIPAVIVALLQGSTVLPVSNWVFALIIVGFYLLVQQFENTFVVPRILGDAVNLPPLVVILGVLIGANVGGILGALLAAPVIASIREIVRYLYMKILGEVPFPPTEEEEDEAHESSLTQQMQRIFGRARAYFAKSSQMSTVPPKETPPPDQNASNSDNA